MKKNEKGLDIDKTKPNFNLNKEEKLIKKKVMMLNKVFP